jgi:hypothetical protein
MNVWRSQDERDERCKHQASGVPIPYDGRESMKARG